MESWNECVEAAKNKLGKGGYGFVSGAVLKQAQKAYCAIAVAKK
jgi:hypothetical protein